MAIEIIRGVSDFVSPDNLLARPGGEKVSIWVNSGIARCNSVCRWNSLSKFQEQEEFLYAWLPY